MIINDPNPYFNGTAVIACTLNEISKRQHFLCNTQEMFSPSALTQGNLSASISPSSPLQMERIDEDLSCNLSSFRNENLFSSNISAYKDPAAPLSHESGLSHTFYELSLLERKILVPQAYLFKHDKFAIRDRRAFVNDNDYQLNSTAISAFIYTVSVMKTAIEQLCSEKDRAIRDLHVREGELRHYRLRAEDTAKLLDENARMKKSSVEFFQDLERLAQRTKTLEEEILIHRQHNQKLVEENRQIDILKQLLKEEKDISGTLSRKIQETEHLLEEKNLEIQRLEQALQKAIAEYDRQRDNATTTTTTAPLLGAASNFSSPLAKGHLPSATPQSRAKSERKRNPIVEEGFDQEEQRQMEHSVSIHTSNYLDSTYLHPISPFPTGISFQKQYSEFVSLLRTDLSAILTACRVYPEFYSEFSIIGQHMASIFVAADQYVKEFSCNALIPVLNRIGLKRWPYYSSTNNDSDVNFSSFATGVSSSYPDIFQYICSEMQNQSYLAVEAALAQLNIAFFPSDIQQFHNMLVRLSNMDTQQASSSTSLPMLSTSSMENFVLRLFCQFAKFLWIAQFSHPPCVLSPMCGSVLVDASDICEEITSFRRFNVTCMNKKEIVLVPALYFYADHDRDMLKAQRVAPGLSYSLQSTNIEEYPPYLGAIAGYWSTMPFSAHQLTTLPRVGSMTYLNAILQLLIHCPPMWRFLNASITSRIFLPEILKLYQSANKDSLMYALYSLGRKMLESNSSHDLIGPVQALESILASMHPMLLANKHPSDAATLLLLLLIQLQKEFKDFKFQASTPPSILYPGVFKRSMSLIPPSPLQPHAQDTWRAILHQEGNGENPIVEMNYPLRRCSRVCVHCLTTTVSFDIQPIITLPIPTVEQRTSLRSLSNTNVNGTLIANKAMKDLFRVTVIVQLLEGVPAMVSLPLMVSKSTSIADLKRMIVEHLVVLQRWSPPSKKHRLENASSALPIVDIDDDVLSKIHFHICTLEEFDPMKNDKQAWKVLNLSVGYDATGSEEWKDNETQSTITIGDIFSESQLEQSRNRHLDTSCILVACQLSEPAPVNNDVQSREPSDFIYYDVSFASFRLQAYPNKWKIDPIELSIPFRLAYDIGMGYPSQNTLQRHIEHLAARIFPSKKTQHLFETSNSSATANQAMPAALPSSYEVEMFFLTKKLTDYNSAPSSSSSSSSSSSTRHPQKKCTRIVAGVYHAPQNVNKSQNLTAQYTIDRVACCTVYEPISRQYQGKTSLSMVNYKAVSLRTMLLQASLHAATSEPDMSQGYTLVEAFQTLSLPKPLPGVYCTSCQTENLQVAYDYWQVGEVIMVHLTPPTSGLDVAHASCWYPKDSLDIRDILACGDTINTTAAAAGCVVPTVDGEEQEEYLYDLYGVVERHAHHNPEQYVTFARVDEHDPNRWVCFNDIVAMEANAQELRPDRVYLLCYVRRQRGLF